jgi:hypothetical protein
MISDELLLLEDTNDAGHYHCESHHHTRATDEYIQRGFEGTAAQESMVKSLLSLGYYTLVNLPYKFLVRPSCNETYSLLIIGSSP